MRPVVLVTTLSLCLCLAMVSITHAQCDEAEIEKMRGEGLTPAQIDAACQQQSNGAELKPAAELQQWLLGSWTCQYGRTTRVRAVYRPNRKFEWLVTVGRAPYSKSIRIWGAHEVVAQDGASDEGVLQATIDGSNPEDPQYYQGRLVSGPFTRTGPDTLSDENGTCERKKS